jgi:hypothetical protein
MPRRRRLGIAARPADPARPAYRITARAARRLRHAHYLRRYAAFGWRAPVRPDRPLQGRYPDLPYPGELIVYRRDFRHLAAFEAPHGKVADLRRLADGAAPTGPVSVPLPTRHVAILSLAENISSMVDVRSRKPASRSSVLRLGPATPARTPLARTFSVKKVAGQRDIPAHPRGTTGGSCSWNGHYRPVRLCSFPCLQTFQRARLRTSGPGQADAFWRAALAGAARY